MIDILKRLAQWAENDMKAEAIALEAKYEIERLRKQNQTMALDHLASESEWWYLYGDKVKEIERLREALRSLIAACDSGKHVPIFGVSGITHEAMLKNGVINRVPAWPVEEARAALKEGE